jgi:hypothetical protein
MNIVLLTYKSLVEATRQMKPPPSSKEMIMFMNSVQADFCPFNPHSKSVRAFLALFHNPTMKQVNPTCDVRVKILSPLSSVDWKIPEKKSAASPLTIFPETKLHVELKNGHKIEFNLEKPTSTHLLQQLQTVLETSVLEQRQKLAQEQLQTTITTKKTKKTSTGKASNTTTASAKKK